MLSLIKAKAVNIRNSVFATKIFLKSKNSSTARKLFIAGDFGHNFDYHGQRREYAMNICAYYTEQAKDPKFRKELYKEVATQWHQLNKKHRGHLEPLSFFDQPYVLRGKNKDLAIKQGRPWILDRLALRATSVLHLAHWRDNVTVQSYLARR